LTPILHARTYTRRVQTARDHAQSHTWSRTVARTSLQYLGPIQHASGDSRLDPSTHRKRAVDTVSMAQAAAPIVPVLPGTTRQAMALRMRPRLQMPCPRSSWPTTVKADAFLLSARRWHVHASPGRARTRQRERTAAAPAWQRRSASAQLSSENHGSRPGV